jgi:hypothetical protein
MSAQKVITLIAPLAIVSRVQERHLHNHPVLPPYVWTELGRLVNTPIPVAHATVTAAF